jgi:hypothetical protein
MNKESILLCVNKALEGGWKRWAYDLLDAVEWFDKLSTSDIVSIIEEFWQAWYQYNPLYVVEISSLVNPNKYPIKRSDKEQRRGKLLRDILEAVRNYESVQVANLWFPYPPPTVFPKQQFAPARWFLSKAPLIGIAIKPPELEDTSVPLTEEGEDTTLVLPGPGDDGTPLG